MKHLYCFLYVLCVMNRTFCVINNVCPTIEDYYTIADNPKCWYDFTVDSNATDTITKHGYPVEIHKGTTPDGYILTIFRIPSRLNNKSPVFLQHGLHASASDFISKGKDSLAFVLADAGYDVWLGNHRGNEYSEGHVNLTTNDHRYWDYSYDEIGLYDIPTQLNVVAEKTGRKGDIVYIGHSLGTTVGLVYGSSYPEEAKKTVKLFILLAPAAGLSNMISPLKLVAPLANQIYSIINNNDLIRITSQGSVLKSIMRMVCLETPLLMKRCFELVNSFYGVKTRVGAEIIPVFFSKFPEGTSIKVIKHISDMVFNIFGQYNYGKDNIKKYRNIFPPSYEVSKLKVPVFIMYSTGDWACSKKDSQILYNQLSSESKIYGVHEVSDTRFNHIDFIFGRSAKTEIYNHILSLISRLK